MKERTKFALIVTVFLGAWFLPVSSDTFRYAVFESLKLTRWYAREHVLLCLVPAFFIAGAGCVFVSQGAVMKYLGPKANKWIAYPVAAASHRHVGFVARIKPVWTLLRTIGSGAVLKDWDPSRAERPRPRG